uniref:Uncharacterized protein n=1 Tax=Avena sativa TaxID=4498 RepID=A0ACD5TSH3_AVESA
MSGGRLKRNSTSLARCCLICSPEKKKKGDEMLTQWREGSGAGTDRTNGSLLPQRGSHDMRWTSASIISPIRCLVPFINSSTGMPPKPAPCGYSSRNRKRKNVGDTDNDPNRSAQSMEKQNIDYWYRCSTKPLPLIMKRIIGNDKQKGYVREIGFESLLSMANFEMNKALTLWLVDKFNCDTEALEFEGGISIPVRPLVKSVLGIPSGPIQVVEGLIADKDLFAQYSRNGNGRAKNAKEVADEMCSMTDKEPFCVAFMMAMLGIYLAPNTFIEVNRALLGAVKQVDQLKDMDWCNFVATYLFKGIKEFKDSETCYVKGCVHILSVIFIVFVKYAAFEVPVGFPRLGVVTTKHIKWVVSHPFARLMVRHPEESIYAAVLDNLPTDHILEDGNCLDSKTNIDDLADTSAATDTDLNIYKHPVSAELGTATTSPNTTNLAIVEHVELGARSAEPSSFAEHIIFPRTGEQLQSSKSSSIALDQNNNKHSVSAELSHPNTLSTAVVNHVEPDTSGRSAGMSFSW